MSTPTFELDRSPAAFIATLEVDSAMMQAPARRWLSFSESSVVNTASIVVPPYDDPNDTAALSRLR